MSKNYRNKDACLAEARRLGIEGAEEMSWPQLQKAVGDALKLEELGVSKESWNDSLDAVGEAHEKRELNEEPKPKRKKSADPMKQYLDKTIVISPELSPERYRLLKYDEVLGDDFEVTERKFDINENDQVFDISGDIGERNTIDKYHDYLSGTYRLKRRSDRKVVAMSSVPKENSGMIFRPGIDLVPVVIWKGRAGYLWRHMRLPNVRALLIESGHYDEYKKQFVDEPNVWYAAGKQLVCNPHLVHRIFQEIQEKEKRNDIGRRMVGGWHAGF